MSNDTLALLARCKAVVARLLEDEARLDRAVFFTTCGDDDDEQYSLMLNMHRCWLELALYMCEYVAASHPGWTFGREALLRIARIVAESPRGAEVKKLLEEQGNER
jgi:hypothetical protein